jgi:hypothetical protein
MQVSPYQHQLSDVTPVLAPMVRMRDTDKAQAV